MDPLDQPLAAISAQLAEGTITARTLVEAAQARHDPSLNAYKSWAPDFARRQAAAADAAFAAGNRLGSLQGIPVSVKDIYGVEGLDLCRQPARAPARWRQEGAVVHRLRRQLAVIMGKSHTVEFAFGGLGVNAHWPVPGTRKTARSIARRGLERRRRRLLGRGDGPCRVWHRHRRIGAHPGKRHRHCRREDHQGPLADRRHRSAQPDLRHRRHAHAQRGRCRLRVRKHRWRGVPPLEHLGGVGHEGRALLLGGADPGVAERVAEGLRLAAAAGAVQSDLALPGALEVYDCYHRGGIVSAELYSFLSCDLPEWIETLDRRVRNRMEAERAGGVGLSAAPRALRPCSVAALRQRCARLMRWFARRCRSRRRPWRRSPTTTFITEPIYACCATPASSIFSVCAP